MNLLRTVCIMNIFLSTKVFPQYKFYLFFLFSQTVLELFFQNILTQHLQKNNLILTIYISFNSMIILFIERQSHSKQTTTNISEFYYHPLIEKVLHQHINSQIFVVKQKSSFTPEDKLYIYSGLSLNLHQHILSLWLQL